MVRESSALESWGTGEASHRRERGTDGEEAERGGYGEASGHAPDHVVHRGPGAALAGVFLLPRLDTPREEAADLRLGLGRERAGSLLVAGERLADGAADGKTRQEGGEAGVEGVREARALL